jgi:hypothetical protein
MMGSCSRMSSPTDSWPTCNQLRRLRPRCGKRRYAPLAVRRSKRRRSVRYQGFCDGELAHFHEDRFGFASPKLQAALQTHTLRLGPALDPIKLLNRCQPQIEGQGCIARASNRPRLICAMQGMCSRFNSLNTGLTNCLRPGPPHPSCRDSDLRTKELSA